MKNQVIGSCPICESKLKVTSLSCNNCNTEIKGEFELCNFCNLTQEDKHFIEVFLYNRGNIKEIEKDLGISYPTVRSKLDSVISALGYTPKPKLDFNKSQILDRLNKGEISSKEAIKLLKGE